MNKYIKKLPYMVIATFLINVPLYGSEYSSSSAAMTSEEYDSLHVVHLPTEDNVHPELEEKQRLILDSKAQALITKHSDPDDTTLELFADKEAQRALYKRDGYAHGNIFANLNKASFPTIEPYADKRVYMFPAEHVREFFFKQCASFLQENLEKNYESHNTVEGRTFEEYLDDFFSLKYFGFPLDERERQDYYLTHDFNFLTQDNLKTIFDTAQRIISATGQDENIVIFGNSPSFYGHAIALIMESDPTIRRNLINLAFSGAPNRARPDYGYEQHNVTTQENLDHLKKRLLTHGLMGDNPKLLESKTYFVDVIESCSGPAYVIETILRDFQEKGIKETPRFEMISLNEFVFGRRDSKGQESIASREAKDGDRLTLSLPSKTDVHFTIPCQVIYTPEHLTVGIMQDHHPKLRIVPQYNPVLWQEKYDYLLTREPSFRMKLMLEHFDANIRHLLMGDVPPKTVEPASGDGCIIT